MREYKKYYFRRVWFGFKNYTAIYIRKAIVILEV